MKKLFAVLMLFALSVLAGCLTSSSDGDGGNGGGWQVYGYVNNAKGSAIKDVSLNLIKGGKTVSTTTTSAWYYVFNDIPNGTYTVVPSKSGYTFSPAEVRNVIVSGDRTVVETFIGSAN